MHRDFGFAQQLTQYLKPGVITIYARQALRPLNMLITRHQLRRDPKGTIEVLDAFWPANLPVDQPGLVPTPLIHADLLATGDARGLETAKLIYKRYLAGRFLEV
ncbi:MAG TPA: type IV toxin-antitoxin system AbiEi family antitoxin [Steroidobacteraceae bacterium]|nr:type IV toxin-antitoxin system AbiEi family antitoxin [Steroidobacteraceae bacterium]